MISKNRNDLRNEGNYSQRKNSFSASAMCDILKKRRTDFSRSPLFGVIRIQVHGQYRCDSFRAFVVTVPLRQSHGISGIVFPITVVCCKGLDDVSASKTLKFIIEFCNRDKERIILMCSHQEDISSKYANRRYHISGGVLREVLVQRNQLPEHPPRDGEELPQIIRDGQTNDDIVVPETRVAEIEYYI